MEQIKPVSENNAVTRQNRRTRSRATRADSDLTVALRLSIRVL